MLKYFPYLLIFIGASARLLPHAPNFAPIAALALFGAVYLKRRDGLWVPLVALLMSDLIIGFYNPKVMLSVYGSFLIIGALGILLRKWKSSVSLKKWGIRAGGVAILGSILFFLITNWAVWAYGSLYPHTLEGLVMSYWMGLPFFRNTLLGDVFYVGVFFGVAELVPVLLRQRLSIMKTVKSRVMDDND